MVAFNKLLSSVLLAVCYASFANAGPYSPSIEHATRRVRHVGRDLQVETFHPKTTYQTFGKGIDHPTSLTKRDPGQSAVDFTASQLGTDASTLEFKTGFNRDGVEVAYVKQVHDSISFANTAANVAFKDDKVVAFGSSLIDTAEAPSSTPSIPFSDIIATVESALEGTYNDQPGALEYLVKADGSISLAHVIQIQNDDVGTWYEAFIDAHNGEILSVTDFVNDASYTVLPIVKQDPREGLEILTDPVDLLASPEGWHTVSATEGNNVVSYKGAQTATTRESGSDLEFDYAYDPSVGPTEGDNVDASRVQGFYIMNVVHDLAYRYGFTEAAFNFQNDNFGKGGAGNDRVLMSVQDASGTNNANFATPPDGQSGRCRMYTWTMTTPNRDGVFQNDIPVHEMTHGITNRLTGGGTGRCLQTLEAGGMGEGWSDALGEWTELKGAPVPDFALAGWVVDDPAGIRTHPYSTDKSINPLAYSDLQVRTRVHDIGVVWATILHGILTSLVDTYGYSATAYTDPDGTEGNVVYLHLFIDALSLQPCNPTFLDARDAWIQADENRYGGANRCLLWTGFADRGLGPNAADHEDDFSLPSDC